MRRKTFNPLHKISVKFSDYEGNAEGAIDAGGPSREMFRLVLEYLKNSELFTGKNKKHITLNNRCIQDNLYVEAGKIIALSLVHGGPGPHFFSQTLFSLLAYGHENTVPTLDDVDEDIRTAIVKLQELEILSDLQEMLISVSSFPI
uniref:HECT domain-containing protein n=2 Tax=Photinus pyralis TaxID=7054 RepID=A0A1Y1JV40_PHOPY